MGKTEKLRPAQQDVFPIPWLQLLPFRAGEQPPLKILKSPGIANKNAGNLPG